MGRVKKFLVTLQDLDIVEAVCLIMAATSLLAAAVFAISGLLGNPSDLTMAVVLLFSSLAFFWLARSFYCEPLDENEEGGRR